MMSFIETKDDIDMVIEDFITSSIINIEQAAELKALVYEIVTHQKLEMFFSKNNIIYNERDIITKEGAILRPDRVVVNINNGATIIDYKTGFEDHKHEQQLRLYQDLLESMNLTVINKFLIYINDLHNSIRTLKVYHLADDTNLLNISNNQKEQLKNLNNDLKALYLHIRYL